MNHPAPGREQRPRVSLIEAAILQDRREREERRHRRAVLLALVIILGLYAACSVEGHHSDSAARPLELDR